MDNLNTFLNKTNSDDIMSSIDDYFVPEYIFRKTLVYFLERLFAKNFYQVISILCNRN